MSLFVTKTGLEPLTRIAFNSTNNLVTKISSEVFLKNTVIPINRVTKISSEIFASALSTTNKSNRITKLTSEIFVSADESFRYNGSTQIGTDGYTFGYLNTPGYLSNLINGASGTNLQVWFKYENLPLTSKNYIFWISIGEVAGINLLGQSNTPGAISLLNVTFVNNIYSNPLSGANNAMLYQMGGNPCNLQRSITMVTGSTYTDSLWVKGSSGSIGQNVTLQNTGLSGTNFTNVTLSNTWQRISITGTASSTGGILQLYGSGGPGTANVSSSNRVFIYNFQHSLSGSALLDQVNPLTTNFIARAALAARIDPSNQHLLVTYNPSLSDNLAEIDTGQALIGDTWYHLSMNADYLNKIYTTYLNGTSVNSYTYTGAVTSFTKGSTFNFSDFLGTNDQQYNIGGSSPYLRLIDFRLYNASKNSTSINTDINYHYISKNTNSLVSALRLDNTEVAQIKDYKANSYAGRYFSYLPNTYPGAVSSLDIPVNTTLLNPSIKTFTVSYNINFLTLIANTFNIKYTLNYIHSQTYNFTVKYILGRVGLQTHTFTLPYTLSRGSTTNYSFQFRYNLGKIQSTPHTFTLPYSLEKYSGDISFGFGLPYSYPLISSHSHTFQTPYTISEVTGTSYTFRIPYTVTFLVSTSYSFTLPSEISKVTIVDRTFTLPYQNELVVPSSYGFNLKYSIDELLVTDVLNVFNLQFVEQALDRENYLFQIGYNLGKVQLKTRIFSIPYSLTTVAAANLLFHLPYNTNVIPRRVIFPFFARYKLNKVGSVTRSFGLRYKLDLSRYRNINYSFLLRYRLAEKQQFIYDFNLQFRTQKYNINTVNFKLPYLLRKQETEIISLINFYEQ